MLSHVHGFECVFVCVCRILDVQPNRLSVGGVRSIEPVLHRRGQVATHDFVGCIMEFAVNGRPLEPSQALASRGILDRSAAPHPSSPSSSSYPSISSNLLDSRCGTSLHTFKPSREFLKKRCLKKKTTHTQKWHVVDQGNQLLEFQRIYFFSI